jgi:FtsH-binding integral membrane protein
VYGILTLQLLLTIGTCVLMTRHAATRAFVLATPALSFTAMGLSFVVLVSLFCFKDRHPLNVFLLAAFTLCESYVLGVVCAQYVQAGHARIILQALALTAAVFVALTVFAFQVRRRRS